MSISIDIDLSGAERAERSLEDVDTAIEDVENASDTLGQSTSSASRSLSQLGQDLVDIGSDLIDAEKQALATAKSLEELGDTLVTIATTAERGGLMGAAAGAERIQTALDSGGEGARKINEVFGSGAVFTDASGDALQLVEILQAGLEDAVKAGLDPNGEEAQSLKEQLQNIKITFDTSELEVEVGTAINQAIQAAATSGGSTLGTAVGGALFGSGLDESATRRAQRSIAKTRTRQQADALKDELNSVRSSLTGLDGLNLDQLRISIRGLERQALNLLGTAAPLTQSLRKIRMGLSTGMSAEEAREALQRLTVSVGDVRASYENTADEWVKGSEGIVQKTKRMASTVKNELLGLAQSAGGAFKSAADRISGFFSQTKQSYRAGVDAARASAQAAANAADKTKEGAATTAARVGLLRKAWIGLKASAFGARKALVGLKGVLLGANGILGALTALAAIPIAGVVIGLSRVNRQLAQTGQRLRVIRSQTDVSLQAMQEFFLIGSAIDSEVTLDSAREAMQEFARRSSEAAEGGNEVAEAFTAIGVSEDDLQTKTQAELFDLTLRKLRELEPAQRTFRADQILGGQAAESFARALALTEEQYESLREEIQESILSESEIAQLDAITRAYDAQDQRLQDQAQTINVTYGPALVRLRGLWTGVKEAINSAIISVAGFFRLLSRSRGGAGTMGKLFTAFTRPLDELDEERGAGAPAEAAEGEDGAGPGRTFIDVLNERQEAIDRANEDLQAGLTDYEEYLQELLQAERTARQAARDLDDAPENFIAGRVPRILGLERQISDVQNPRPPVPQAAEPQDRTIDVTMPDFDEPLDLFTPVRDIRDRFAVLSEFYGEAEAKRRIVRDLEQAILSIMNGETDATDEQLNMLQTMLQFYRRKNREAAEAREREEALAEAMRRVEDRLVSITVSFYDSLIDGSQDFEDALQRAGEDALRAIVKSSAAAALARIFRPESRDQDIFDGIFGAGAAGVKGKAKGKAARQAAPGQTRGLTGTQSAVAGTSGVIVGQGVQQATGSKVAGALAGGLTSAGTAALLGAGPLGIALLAAGGLFGGFFATGGRPPTGKASIVGERGPELFVPDSTGMIIPNEGLQPSLPEMPGNSALISEVRELRAATEAALNRPAQARITRKDFREAEATTRRYSRQKNARNLRK